MQVVILAGGLGTRISEESHLKPKPMIEIGGRPLLWHVMKVFGAYGLTDFIICCGYKGYVIKEYFANYPLHMSDVTIDVAKSTIKTQVNTAEPWKVTLVDTGDHAGTGGRLRQIKKYINGPFCMTYGDGVADVDIEKLVLFHNRIGKQATVTGVTPASRFGSMKIEADLVTDFKEKPSQLNQTWINGGFFVLEQSVLDLIEDDAEFFEQTPMEKLVSQKQLAVHRHYGFWHAMDTLKDKKQLEQLWASGKAPWKVWE